MRRSMFIAGFLFLAVATGVEAQASLKIGYINSQSILEQAPGAQEASQQFNRDMQEARNQVQSMSSELQAMIQQYEQQQVTLSPEAKQEREAAIRAKQQEYQQRVTQLDQVMGQRQAELAQPIMDRITQVIEQLRVEGDYALIFDVSVGAVIAADPALDLTDEVIRRLQAQPGSTGDDGGDGSDA